MSSGDPHNFLNNKQKIDDFVNINIVHKQTKNIDEYLDNVMNSNSESIAYLFEDFPNKQVKKIFLAEDIDENISKMIAHIDKDKICQVTNSSKYFCYFQGKQKIITELNYLNTEFEVIDEHKSEDESFEEIKEEQVNEIPSPPAPSSSKLNPKSRVFIPSNKKNEAPPAPVNIFDEDNDFI
jgi:hypothetical protein